ncbi:hypothetical protein BDV95DRAFT_135403 [Massariosphaeria phaeospora]|uniref:Uncharacterized protein n=1 Tax=Massariosphaeria phaeospora TaxID=100035 RepID=A0A7C8IP34_9PLEO|nr:hypothetical protein BDV95DRAFT_135403 [Massariosphaeria phaeospora]
MERTYLIQPNQLRQSVQRVVVHEAGRRGGRASECSVRGNRTGQRAELTASAGTRVSAWRRGGGGGERGEWSLKVQRDSGTLRGILFRERRSAWGDTERSRRGVYGQTGPRQVSTPSIQDSIAPTVVGRRVGGEKGGNERRGEDEERRGSDGPRLGWREIDGPAAPSGGEQRWVERRA